MIGVQWVKLQDGFLRQIAREYVASQSGLKRSGALLGSNPARNRAGWNDENGQGPPQRRCPCLPILRVHINAKKNPLMKRFLFSVVSPLWLLRFFLSAVNVPSILLLVFGIPAQSSRWQVKRYGR